MEVPPPFDPKAAVPYTDSDAPPAFDPKAAVPYTDSEAPPPFDPKTAQPYSDPEVNPTTGIPMQGTPVSSGQPAPTLGREQELYYATTGLSPENRQIIESLPSGKYIAPVANLAARVGETALQVPQYLADRYDDFVGQPVANTLLEMMMSHGGEGDALNASLKLKAPEVPGTSSPVPAAGHIAEAAQAAYDQGGKAAALDVFSKSGYTPEMVAEQSSKIDAAEKTGPARFVPEAPDLAKEAETFQPQPQPESPLAQEAAAFKPKAEPTPEDLFPTDESRAATEQAQTAKLQAEADAFKGTPDEPPPFDPQTAEPASPEIPQERTKAQVHADNLTAHINILTKDWNNPPDVVVHPDTSTIADPSMKAAVESKDGYVTPGLYKDGIVHIFAHNIKTPADATGVLYHEALAHHGLAQKFGADLDTHLEEWYNKNNQGFKVDVDAWLKKHPDAYKGGNRIARAAEEVLAERTEKGKPLAPGLKARIAYTIRAYARKMGIKIGHTDADINTILGMAHQAVVDGKESAAANGFKFSRKWSRLDSKGQDEDIDFGPKGVQPVRTFRTDEINDAVNPTDVSDGRGSWQTAMVDNRRGSRAAVAYDKDFWKRKQENKTPEEWDAEQAAKEPGSKYYTYDKDGNLKMSDEHALEAFRDWENHPSRHPAYDPDRIPPDSEDALIRLGKEVGLPGFEKYSRKRINEDPSDEGAKEVVRIGGLNVGRIDTFHDLTSAATKLAENAEPLEPMSLSDMKAMGKSLGLTPKQVAGGKGVRGGLQSIADLPGRIAAVRQAHADILDSVSRFEPRLAKNFNDADHANFLKKFSEAVAIDARLRDDRAAISRSMSAFRIITQSNKKASALLKELSESEGGLAYLADKDNMIKFMAQMKAMIEDDNKEGAANLAVAMVKPYWWEKVLTGRNAAMLSGLSTHTKNFADNSGLLSRDLLDHAVGMVGGNITPTEMAGRVQALGRGLFDMQAYKHILRSIKDAGKERGLEGDNSSKFEQATGHAYVPIASHVLAILEGSDHFFKNLHMGMNLRGEGIRQAQAEGLSGIAALERGEYLAQHPTPEVHARALAAAKRNLLQDPSSAATKWIERAKQIRPGMDAMEQTAAFAAHIIFPFVRVSDRTLARMFQRSPIGLMKTFNKSLKDALETGNKADRDRAYASAAIGTALIALYWYKASQGKITPPNPNFQKVDSLSPSGYQPGSVDDKDYYTDATAVGTNVLPWNLHNQTAVNVAALQDAYHKGADFKDVVKGMSEALVGMINSNSVLSDITPAGEAAAGLSQGDPKGAGTRFAASTAGSFYPNIAKQLNQYFLDPTKRDTTGDKSVLDEVGGTLQSGTPWSKSLPARYDIYGQPEDTGKSFFGVSNYNMKSNDPTIREMTRLENTQPDKPLITKAPNRPWNVDGGTIVLTADQRAEYQKISGQAFKTTMDQIVAHPNWKGLNVADKKTVVKEALKEARSQAKETMLSDGSVDTKDIKQKDKSDEAIQ